MAQKRLIARIIATLTFLTTLLIYPATSSATDMPEEEKYIRKSITYLKIVFTPEVDTISKTIDFFTGFNLKEYLEKRIRQEIEMGRFDYNPVEIPGNTDLEALAKLVKEYVDMVKVDRARAEAKMDWRFKDLVVTAEDIRKIANSAYIYWPEVKKFQVTVIPVERKNEIKLSIIVEIGVKVNYYKVDFETGKPAKVAEIYEEHKEREIVGEMDLVQLPFPLSLLAPSVEIPETPLDTFVRCSGKVIYWLSKRINKSTREIPDFSLHARITSKSLSEVYSPLQKRDGVYLDSDFAVIEEIDEGDGRISERRVGWVRARKIADGEKEELSSFHILSGSPQIGQKIVEYPLIGVGLFLEGLYSLGNSILVDTPGFDRKEGKGAFGISLLGRINFATALGIRISELYLVAGPQLLFIKDGVDVGANIGLRKKFYVIRSLAISPEVLLNISSLFIILTKSDTQETFGGEGTSVGILPQAYFEWFIHPRFSVFLGSGYRLSSEITEIEVSKGDYKWGTLQIKYNPSGLFFAGGLEFTLW